MMSIRRCKLSKKNQRKLVEFFVLEVTARSAGNMLGIQANTAALFYRKLREVIMYRLEEEWPFDGEVEVDESYFGGERKGKRGRGAAGKVPVFGLLKRGGKVYAVPIPSTKSSVLMGIIRERTEPDSIIYTDALGAYDVLDVSEFHHHRINHSETFVGPGRAHINGIENFWNQAKRHLRRYNGIPKASFPLFLKECEWRFNYRPASKLLRTLKSW